MPASQKGFNPSRARQAFPMPKLNQTTIANVKVIDGMHVESGLTSVQRLTFSVGTDWLPAILGPVNHPKQKSHLSAMSCVVILPCHLGLALLYFHSDHDTGMGTAYSLELDAQWLWLMNNERNVWKVASGQMVGKNGIIDLSTTFTWHASTTIFWLLLNLQTPAMTGL